MRDNGESTMPRRILRRVLPSARQIRDEGHLKLFGDLLHNPNLWHLNRNSVAGAVSIGLFMAFVPVPFQMVLAAAAAIAVGRNLPIAVVMVWVTNPVTMPPIFFAAYKTGAWLLDETPKIIQFEISFRWLFTKLGDIWEPFLLGCAVLATFTAALGNVAVRLLWRLQVIRNWRERKDRREKRAQDYRT